MPSYVYEVVDPVSGEVLGRVTAVRAVDARDAVAVRRSPLPERVSIAGAAADPTTAENRMLRAYRRIEERVGNNREFARRIGHPPEVVKQAWSTAGAA